MSSALPLVYALCSLHFAFYSVFVVVYFCSLYPKLCALCCLW
jgi:hypothetical protein